MVEPLTSVVLNSLLSARNSTIGPIILAYGLPPAPKKYVSSNFFTPTPRRTKGEQITSDQTCLEQLFERQEWTRCSIRHSDWCPIHCRKLVLDELFASRVRLSRREPSRLPRSLHTRTRANIHRSAHALHHKHALHASEPVRLIALQFSSLGGRDSPPDSLNTSASIPAEQFEQLSQLNPRELNLDVAWNTYLAALKFNVLGSRNLMDLIEYMIRAVEWRREDLGVPDVHRWGKQLLGALLAMLSPSPAYDGRRHCLMARCLSILDDPNQALELLHTAHTLLEPSEDLDNINAYEAIALAIHRRHDPVNFLRFLAHEWYILMPLLRYVDDKDAQKTKSLRFTLHHILASIKNPHIIIDSVKNDWSPKLLWDCCRASIILYCRMRRPASAFHIYDIVRAQGFHDREQLLGLRLITCLTRTGNLRAAATLFESLRTHQGEPSRRLLVAGLEIYSGYGDPIRAKQLFDELTFYGWVTHEAKVFYIQSYVACGDMQTAVELFNEFYPETEDGSRLNFPTGFAFSVLIHGFSRKGDLAQINKWMDLMSKAGHKADMYIYGAIINGFARHDDMISIASVISQMKEAGLTPNLAIYTTIMSVLARRGDTEGTELIYMGAIKNRVIPDRHMINTLINAHVEARSWHSVIKIFNHFKSTYIDHVHGLGVETYNTFLKAYVEIGSPYRLVLRLFNKIKSSGIEPDAYTYSLLIQSACDHGLVNVATNIFWQMNDLPESDRLITVQCMTSIMSGFFRIRDGRRAKAVLKEMIRRGIQPSAVSIGTLMKNRRLTSFRTPLEDLFLADEFIKSLSPKDAEWNTLIKGQRTPLENVYGGLLQGYAIRGCTEDVERLYQDILEAGGQPTLNMLTILLKSYQVSSKPENMKRLWPEIVQLASEYTEDAKKIEDMPRYSSSHSHFRESILCIPLSIYMDGMSMAGYHTEVANAWRQCKTLGFGLDSHNWNHLVVALLRAGSADFAFRIMENIILPKWSCREDSNRRMVAQTKSFSKRDATGDDEPPGYFDYTGVASAEVRAGNVSDLSDNTPAYEADVKELSDDPVSAVVGDPQVFIDQAFGDTVVKTPHIFRDITTSVVSHAQIRDRAKRINMDAAPRATRHVTNALFSSDSDVRPLRIFRHTAPKWHVWRPHARVIKMLCGALARLRSGNIIEPLGHSRIDKANELPEVKLERQKQAWLQQKRIHENYPRTVKMITLYTKRPRLRKRRRRGMRYTKRMRQRIKKKYQWS